MSAPSTPTSEAAPFAPIDYTSWEATPEAARIADPLEKVQAYDNRLRKDLFKAGLYDVDAESEIVNAGADQALRAGLISDPAEYAPVAKPRDPSFLARQLVRQGDTAKAQDIYRYQSFLGRPDTDPETLERARLAAEVDPETENELVRKAVRSGELPFAVVPDKDGNAIFEIDPELGALNRQQLLDLAGDDFDPRFLPDLEKQLTRVSGTNYTPTQFRQAGVFDTFLKEQIKTDDFLFGELEKAQTEYDRFGQLSPETQESLDRTLASLDADGEFAPATRGRLIRDTIKRGSKPEGYDPENPQQHIQYLEDGTVWLPEQTIFDATKHDALVDSLNVTPEQKEAAKKLRAGRLESIAPAMVDALGANPDALDFWESSKAAGKTDSEIATEWYSKPENYGWWGNRARSFGMSLYEAGPGLYQAVKALAGSESAREAIQARQQDMARNEEYARLFGDSYGVGQTLLNTASQVAADVLVGIGVSAVATPVAGAAVIGARATGSSLVRGLARAALTEGARSTAAGFLRSGTGSAARTLATLGDDLVSKMAREAGGEVAERAAVRGATRAIAGQTGVAASSFTRSAGSGYVQAYSALDAQTNPAGQPLYSDEEKRKIALGTAITQGAATAAITLGFGKLLGGGVEDLVTGKIGTGILKRVYGATDEQIVAATRTSAMAILMAAGAEAPEEAADTLVGGVIQAIGTGEEFRLGQVLKEALEAGLVGGLLGAGTKSIEVGIDKFRSAKVAALEKANAPASAAALEAKTKAAATTPAAKPTVVNQDGLRIQENPPLSPDPFSYGEEDPDAPNPALTPSAPPSYEPGDLTAGYGDEPAVGITDTGGAVRVSAAEIEGQIDAVDVQIADLKIVSASETEGQKVRRTRRLQELNAEKIRLKAAVKNAKASGGFVLVNTTNTTAEQAAITAEAEVAALDEEIAALSVAPAKETKAAATKREASLEKVRVARAEAAAVAQTRRAAAPIPRGAEGQSDPRALDYGDGGELSVQDNTLGGTSTPGSTPESAQTDATPAVPEDIIGTDQAPEPPEVEAEPEPVASETPAAAPVPEAAAKPETTKATKFSRKARALVERLLTPESRNQPPEYLQQQKAFTPTQTTIQARIAALYEALPVDDSANPEVVQAYQNLVTEVVAQYRAMLETGIKIEMGSENPYATSGDMINDVERGRLWIYKTEPGSYGSDASMVLEKHPMLAPTEFTDLNGEPMLANDVFRAVHDYVAHAAFGFSFGPLGEEAAWKAHLSTLRDPLARLALTTETRGQNSWVNYRPEMVRDGMPIKKGEPGYVAPQDRPFATQKFALLPEEAMTLVPIASAKPKTKKPTDASLAAEMRAGRPLPIHETLFNDTISQGWVPTRNILLDQLSKAGFGGQRYGKAFAETVEARVRELYPVTDVSKQKGVVFKTLDSLGFGDIKGPDNKTVKIPMFADDNTSGPFTNDPQTTAWQKNAGLSIKVPDGVAVNPAIRVNPRTGFVDYSTHNTGARIYAKGDFKRAGNTIGSYIAFQNKTGFGESLATLPPFDSSKVTRPVDFAGFEILPGETTEDDILRFFFAPSSDGGPSKIESAINASASGMSAVDKDQIRAAAQLSFIRELREFTLDMNDVGSVNPKGFQRTPDGYKAGIENRIANVWSKADRGKDGVIDTSKHWNERGRPSHLAFFVKTAIAAQESGNEIRPDANVQLGSDDVDQATALERAAARNDADGPDEIVAVLDEIYDPETLRGIGKLAGREGDPVSSIASSVADLVAKIEGNPKLRSAINTALISTHVSAPGSPARIRFAALIKTIPASEVLVLAGQTAFTRQQLSNISGLFKSISYGLNTFTDAEIAQHRADNRAAIADLQLDGDLRSAIERIARSAKYPRRYRAAMLAALKMQVLPNIAIVDAPTEAYAGSYIHSGRLITLNIASSNGRGMLDVLAHELLHAATIEAVANPQTKAAKDLLAKLERARQKAAEVIPDDMAYAVSSIDEFITHAATDPRLQVILRETFEKGKTTWQRVVDAVAKFFGIANSDFVSDLWGFINHAAEYGFRVGVAGSREARAAVSAPEIQLSPAVPAPDTGIDQHLPVLPAGVSYEFDDSRPKYLAYARRSKPGVVTVNKAALAAAIEGLDPANARAIVSKVVKHEIAHLAAFSAFTDADIAEMAGGMSTSEIDGVARRYYNSPDALARLAADLESGAITNEALVEEYLRMQLELASDGSTTEATIAFHSDNPGFVARLVKYLKDALVALWQNVAGPREDYVNRIAISRLAREYRAILRGHKPLRAEPFDPADPGRDDNYVAALAPQQPTDPDADAAIRETFTESLEDFTKPYEPGSLWRRLFVTRTGDRRFPAISDKQQSSLVANEKLVYARRQRLNDTIKEETPDAQVLAAAAGDTSPTTTPEQDAYIASEFAAAMAEARGIEDPAEQATAVAEAYKMKQRLTTAAYTETARIKKRRIDEAFAELKRTAPKSAANLKAMREGIDNISRIVKEYQPEASPLRMVFDAQDGIYLTRVYRIHHKDGDPLSIFSDPAMADVREAAQDQLMASLIEIRTAEIIEQEAEAGKIIGETEARAVALKEAKEQDLGRILLEDYLLSHGSKALPHNGTDFRTDLTRFFKKMPVPEALRNVLEEVTDPVELLTRTGLNVGMLAASTVFTRDLARAGFTSGAMVTGQQRASYRKLIQEPDNDKYLAMLVDNGWAKRVTAPGYVEIAPDVHIPAWLVKAKEERDLTYLEDFRPVATTTKKFGAGKLADLYAHPTVADWMDHQFTRPKSISMDDAKFVQKMGEVFAKATGMSLGVATLGSVGFFSRNLVGTAFFLAANGINPFSAKSMRASRLAVEAFLNTESGEVTKLTGIGVLNDDLRPQTIKELLKGETDKPGGLNILELIGRVLGGKKGVEYGAKTTAGLAKLADLATAIDGIAKATAYYVELETVREAYPDKPTKWHEDEAAKVVKLTHQAKSQTPPIIDSLTSSSYGRLFAPFLRFKSEIFRLTGNIIAQSAAEIRSDNPAIRARGYKRAAGFAMTSAFSVAGPALISAMYGVGDDEEYALREALPPYLRGNSIIYIPSADGKSITSLDFTYLNPYSFVGDPISRMGRAVMRGEPGDGMDELAIWINSNFLSEQILAGAAMEVLRNEDSDGRPITFETDSADEKLIKFSKHLVGSSFMPQSLKALRRSYDTARRGTPEDTPFFESAAGVLVGHGMPIRPRAFETEALALKAARKQSGTNRQVRALAGQLKRRVNYTEGDIQDIVSDLQDSTASLNQDIARMVAGYRGLGLPDAAIAKQLVEAGRSRDFSRAIVFRGIAAGPSITPATRRDMYEAGEAAGGPGGGEKRTKAVAEAMRAYPKVQQVGGGAED
jgi:hypothetical protein